MIILNTTTWEKRRFGKTLAEIPAGKIAYKWKEVTEDAEGIKTAEIKEITLPSCDQKYWKLDGEDVVEMDQAEKDAVDDAEIDSAKSAKKQTIDQKTNVLINNGFEFDSHVFSLSANAVRNWMDIRNNKDDLSFYPDDPIAISAQDIEEYLLDKNDIESFYKKGQAVVKGYLDAGRALKKQVSSATDQAGIDAVVDNRT